MFIKKEEKKKCKGVKQAMVKNKITFENFKDCLFGKLTIEEQMKKINMFRSRGNQQNSFKCNGDKGKI